MTKHQRIGLCRVAAIAWPLVTSSAFGASIYGGETYVGGNGGSGGVGAQSSQLNPGVSVAAGGTAIAKGTQYNFSGSGTPPTSVGTASFSFTSAGVTPLAPVSGAVNATAYSVNGVGMVSGSSSNAAFSVISAVRWSANGTPTALAPISVSSTGASNSTGYVINDSGVVAGSSTQYDSATTSLGSRPVFWAAGATASTAPTPLGTYGTGNYFGTPNASSGSVQSINASGTMAGVVERFDASGNDLGARATVWAAGGGAATELLNLSDATYASTNSVGSYARVINGNGVVGGYSTKYSSSGVSSGQFPVRWTSPTNAQQLDTVGQSTSKTTSGTVYGINAGGDVVGVANNYDPSGTSLGSLPELWKAGGTALTKLAILGTSSTGTSSGNAYSINDSGFSVGNVTDYANGGDAYGTTSGTNVATMWDGSGKVVDLNTLIPTVSATGTTAGWVLLTAAYAITNDGWISGVGVYNPGNGAPNYNRVFLLTTVPEPAALAASGLASLALVRRRRRAS